MVTPEMSHPANPQVQGVLSLSVEDIKDLIYTHTPEDRWIYAGQISRSIKQATGVYVAPDSIGKLIHRELGSVKRLWCRTDWKYTRRRPLSSRSCRRRPRRIPPGLRGQTTL